FNPRPIARIETRHATSVLHRHYNQSPNPLFHLNILPIAPYYRDAARHRHTTSSPAITTDATISFYNPLIFNPTKR
ncbi:hypothetical protein LJC35_05535, partial [Parabacteroides sp. OttesenSCG-928-N08]|nr:hypothetical protein [Parabacteroides sp. OttesenSCG-928-N08]